MTFINILKIEKIKISKKDHGLISLVGFLWMSLPFYLFAESEQTITFRQNPSLIVFSNLIHVERIYAGASFAKITKMLRKDTFFTQ